MQCRVEHQPTILLRRRGSCTGHLFLKGPLSSKGVGDCRGCGEGREPSRPNHWLPRLRTTGRGEALTSSVAGAEKIETGRLILNPWIDLEDFDCEQSGLSINPSFSGRSERFGGSLPSLIAFKDARPYWDGGTHCLDKC